MLEEPKKEHRKLINNSILFFVILTLITILVSAIGSFFGWQATYSRINAITGELEKFVVAVTSQISGEGIRYIFGNAINNFFTFTPLGMIIIALIGVGVAKKSGFLPTLFTIIGSKFNKFWLTFLVVILGIISGFFGDAGYVLLIPLAAILFLSNNRNPITGILVAFVSIASGYSINFFVSGMDYTLIPYTELAGKLIDKNLVIGEYGNLFFVIVTSILLAFLITNITEKIVVPKIPKYKRDEDIEDEIEIGKKEKRGLSVALISALIMFAIFIYMIIPGLPLSGALLDNTSTTYLGKLFSSDSYFLPGFTYAVSLILLISGWLYGVGARTIKNSEQFSDTVYQSLNNIGSLLALIFVASQFIAIFKKTNIGSVITIWFTNMIGALNFSSITLMLLFFVLVGIANLFLISPITKWSILSPVIVPLFMKSNITPEFSQAIYRISESTTSILTPLLPYFVVFIGFLELYNTSEKNITIRNCYKMLWPYSLGIAILWLFVIIAWYIIGLPIGVNVFPTV